MNELRAMGLSAMWLRVAELLGYDTFITFWRLLDGEPFVDRDAGVMRLVLRSFKTYLRYQRNRHIEALAAQGMTWQEIDRYLQRELCEKVSRRHITRLMNRP